MSIRSIMEFNHDMSHEIERNPQAFLTILGQYLASANFRNSVELQRFGITVMASHHHSADVELKVNGSPSSARPI